MLVHVKYPVNGFYIRSPDDSVNNFTIREGCYLVTAIVSDIYIEILYNNKLVMLKLDKFHCELLDAS